jgi:leader peptidase (prepilin peptidase) / N-methyltransferase
MWFEMPVMIAIVVLLGLVVGSFLNVVIYRKPKMMEREWAEQCAELMAEWRARNVDPLTEEKISLSLPRSRCGHCGHRIRWFENIPILSYVFLLRGKCSACKAPISLRYPLIEAVCGVLSGVMVWKFGWSMTTVGGLLLTWVLLTLTMIDADTQLLPDDFVYPLLWLGLLYHWAVPYWHLPGRVIPLDSALLGAVLGYMSLWCVANLFKLLTKKEGMGAGDFKLLAALGAWMGWQALVPIVLLSSVVGAGLGIALILLRKSEWQTKIPFGPYLAGAGWLVWFFGSNVIQLLIGLKV